ncbi:hypothetical protein GCM10008022_22220 [Paenibacillus hunanensis]|nr:hypothetical protein GCM10008022_22220 [Paenibacillus hunanensis]
MKWSSVCRIWYSYFGFGTIPEKTDSLAVIYRYKRAIERSGEIRDEDGCTGVIYVQSRATSGIATAWLYRQYGTCAPSGQIFT